MKTRRRGVKPRSFDSTFTGCRWGFLLVWGLFTRSDTWQPETGKRLCVIAVEGTDQISHSTLNCHRSAEIKGENSPVLCHNLFFFPMQWCHTWPSVRMWTSLTRQQQQDNNQPVTLEAEDYFWLAALSLPDQVSDLMQTSYCDFLCSLWSFPQCTVAEWTNIIFMTDYTYNTNSSLCWVSVFVLISAYE